MLSSRAWRSGRRSARDVAVVATGSTTLLRWAAWGLVSLLSVVSLDAASGDRRLVEAVKERDTTAVRAFLSQQLDVNAAEPDGATALHWAAHWNDLDTAALLMRAGANVNAANDYGVTPLLLACSDASSAMIEALLEAGADPNVILPSGQSPLMTAARTGKVEGVKALLAHGSQVSVSEAVKGQTALMWAVTERHAEVARALIEHEADVDARSKSGFTALMFAAREGDLDMVRLLLANGADVNQTDSEGASALLVATVRGHAALAEFLLEQGADPNADAGYTALHWAAGTWETGSTYNLYLAQSVGEWDMLAGIPAREVKLSLIEALVAHGADPNARVTKDPPRFGYSQYKRNYLIGATPFYLAAQSGDALVMRVLLAYGADPMLPAEDGTQPLLVAAGIAQAANESRIPEENRLEAVQLLLEVGADINAANPVGMTAVHAAAYAGFDTLIRFVADRGAKLNEKTEGGQTPLGIAEGNFLSGFFFDRPSTAAVLRELGAVSEGAVTLQAFEEGKVGRNRETSEPEQQPRGNRPQR